ncbi:hypothetical protein RhiirA5_436386 [Rhizophagus irregularis]|uniref:Uncharacterized protein n=1 Tax=Rhizophagus irregularis TaxID=588596 RepID=A0A2I1FDC4_9GLOM|nr:hypothetical protein RhiirA5_436386 [Rhizophagus irregularis]PKY32379.1 hypothetical protein RhiirB3_450526 [Rhizophagus irregularis]
MEFSDAQLRILIDERKNRNAKYHATTNKKNLTKAFYMAEKYKKGTGNKRSLVGKRSMRSSHQKLQSGQAHSGSVKRSLSRASSSSRSSNTRTSDIMDLFETFPPPSRPVTPSVEIPINSRSVTPSTPSFLQNANVINVTINYGKESDEQQE